MLSSKIIVPFLDKTIIDISYAKKLLNVFDKSLFAEMKTVPINAIVIKEGLTIKEQNITNDKSVHGMIVCGKSDVDFWNEEKQKYEATFCEGKTIYIDTILLDPRLSNRYRFTLAHEFAHWVLHRKSVVKLAKEKKLLPYLSCLERSINIEIIEKAEASCEWQANYLAGALLMPYLPLKHYSKENKLSEYWDVSYLFSQVELLANKYQVSNKAMYVRLRQLEYVNQIKILE